MFFRERMNPADSRAAAADLIQRAVERAGLEPSPELTHAKDLALDKISWSMRWGGAVIWPDLVECGQLGADPQVVKGLVSAIYENARALSS